MAEGIKISEMGETTVINDNTFLPIIKDGENKKYKVENLIDFVKPKYQLNETIIGTWIDGRPIYQAIVKINDLPEETETSGMAIKYYKKLTINDVEFYFGNYGESYEGVGNSSQSYSDNIALNMSEKNYKIELKILFKVDFDSPIPLEFNDVKNGYIVLKYVKKAEV